MYIQAQPYILLTEPTGAIDGYKIRSCLIGDEPYPANTWVVKPFLNHLNLSQEQKKSTGFAVELAFGI